MVDINPELGPIEVLRCLDDDEMSADDVIRWAERRVVTGNTLGQEDTMTDLAALPIGGDDTIRVTALLEDLISEVVDFSISEDDVENARARMESIIRHGAPSSIRKENCIDFVLGCFPEIATDLAERRRFFGGHEPGLYNELSAFSEYIIGAIRQPSEDLTRAAQCIESLFILGDAAIREAATIGVIEVVVNSCMNNGIDLTPLIERLHSHSRRAYDELEVFWQSDHESRRNQPPPNSVSN